MREEEANKNNLHLCEKCLNKSLDIHKGLICRLHSQKPNFKGSCIEFVQKNTSHKKVASRIKRGENESLYTRLDNLESSKIKYKMDSQPSEEFSMWDDINQISYIILIILLGIVGILFFF